MENPSESQSVWNWEEGVTYHTVRYVAPEAGASVELTWTEEVSPEDDERGNGLRSQHTQPLAEFLQSGPRSRPPVEIAEAMLARFGAQNPPWLDAYRLILAVAREDTASARDLIARGVSADVQMGGTTPLYEAIRRQNRALAELLFATGKVDVNRHFPGSEETILMTLAAHAPEATWEPLAARIVAQGADLEARQCWGETALMAAAGAGGRMPGFTTILLKAGASVNAISLHGYTALMKSVMSRYAPVATVRELLGAGADVNALDDQGWSALMWAISNSRVDSVRYLVAAGADVHTVSAPKQKYRNPESVLQLAIDYANPEIVTFISEAINSESAKP